MALLYNNGETKLEPLNFILSQSNNVYVYSFIFISGVFKNMIAYNILAFNTHF